MANPTRSKAKQGRGVARPVRVPGRPLEVVGDDGPREMILPRFGGDRTRLIPRAYAAPAAVLPPGRRVLFCSLTSPDGGANVGALAPVAQMDRASPSGGEGHRFESCRAHSRMTKPRSGPDPLRGLVFAKPCPSLRTFTGYSRPYCLRFSHRFFREMPRISAVRWTLPPSPLKARHATHELPDVFDLGMRAQHRIDGEALLALLMKARRLLLQGPILEAPTELGDELVHVDRLGQVVVGPCLQCLHCGLDLPVAGEDEDGETGIEPAQATGDIDSVHPRHHQVGDHRVGQAAGGLVQEGFRILEDLDPELPCASQVRGEDLGEGGIVI